MRIQVINPNTSDAMTHKIGLAAQAIARPGTQIIACSPDDGPVSIEGHFDEAIATLGVLEEVRKGREQQVDAHIIACFGDPGLLAAREYATAPVIGIAEAAFHMAGLIATRFAVVTTLSRTRIIAEHLLQRYGFSELCTSVRCIDLPVLALEESGPELIERMIEQARRARDEEGAGAIVLGCGGMADLPRQLSEAIGLPVVEGVSAAVKLAESLVDLGLTTSKHGDLADPIGKPFKGRFSYLGR
ncbi:aspartate/glutamate racemase family protein [Pseudomonas cichorii]|uniref:aspartate/glutamate racemase family protein n=1 Tax=Pseudomonas cichorii TaxID=36746 RepID=UPI001C8A6A00|nr:aspartate/glutamate racemase family protein [Pseudomonas cichorii]MBX8515458.1 aspartate/glutamate racemase family protein [Pseudomonas cichorii]MBX8552314.1 aspartate/glutamate racemase family protein [Pseudomonas cichorii]MBX8587159.1 aspartate/glutamate racemase family protein [Pseudomonas cichorii]